MQITRINQATTYHHAQEIHPNQNYWVQLITKSLPGSSIVGQSRSGTVFSAEIPTGLLGSILSPTQIPPSIGGSFQQFHFSSSSIDFLSLQFQLLLFQFLNFPFKAEPAQHLEIFLFFSFDFPELLHFHQIPLTVFQSWPTIPLPWPRVRLGSTPATNYPPTRCSGVGNKEKKKEKKKEKNFLRGIGYFSCLDGNSRDYESNTFSFHNSNLM